MFCSRDVFGTAQRGRLSRWCGSTSRAECAVWIFSLSLASVEHILHSCEGGSNIWLLHHPGKCCTSGRMANIDYNNPNKNALQADTEVEFTCLLLYFWAFFLYFWLQGCLYFGMLGVVHCWDTERKYSHLNVSPDSHDTLIGRSRYTHETLTTRS